MFYKHIHYVNAYIHVYLHMHGICVYLHINISACGISFFEIGFVIVQKSLSLLSILSIFFLFLKDFRFAKTGHLKKA